MERLVFRTAGESHGKAVLALLEGFPAGYPFPREAIDAALGRRQGGHGRSSRQQIESDRVEVLSGLRAERTLGSPLTLVVHNRDATMDRKPPVTKPRPGHADLAGVLKYGSRDARDILERASARETAARVAAGALARVFLADLGIEVDGDVTGIGPVTADPARIPVEAAARRAARDASATYCPDPAATEAMVRAIDEAKAAGDTLGGCIEVVARGVPAGLGACTAWDTRLDARLAGAVMGIQAMKGVEIGLGFRQAAMRGSEVHDPIVAAVPGAGRDAPFARTRNHAGGLEGGISNGEPIVLRAAMKPIATLYRPLPTVDLITRQPAEAAVERSDTCAVPAASVVVEAVVALVLLDALLGKTGGDTVDEVRDRLQAYREALRAY